MNRDGSDQSAHLRDLIRLFYFRISSEMDVHLRHTLDSRKYKKVPRNLKWRGIIIQKYLYIKQCLSVSNIYIASSIKIPFLQQDLIFYIPKPVVPFVNESII